LLGLLSLFLLLALPNIIDAATVDSAPGSHALGQGRGGSGGGAKEPPRGGGRGI
jgi:hypothetical protein